MICSFFYIFRISQAFDLLLSNLLITKQTTGRRSHLFHKWTIFFELLISYL